MTKEVKLKMLYAFLKIFSLTWRCLFKIITVQISNSVVFESPRDNRKDIEDIHQISRGFFGGEEGSKKERKMKNNRFL